MLPGVFNALAAKMAERIGFSAVYLSGGALSAGWAGVPDVGLLTLSEFVDQAEVLASATSLPVLCDADTGFGEAVNVVRTVSQFERAGVAGIHLEDQTLPKRCGHLSGKSLIGAQEMAAKIRAAVESRKDPDFVVVARTDARSVEGFDAALRRAEVYVRAGADAIFPEALESRDEFSAFAKAFDVPIVANMTEFGKSPLLNFDELAELGCRVVLYPLTAFRVAMSTAREALASLKTTGTQRGFVNRMLTRADLYDLIDYKDWEDRDRSFFSAGPE